ncbi:hypothetical protein LTR84_001579 [Exophiala bonariae]|uniref:2'-phosphotransferase n=1 Tax=Exophiala bonariae TaxID=1690606 RepID=A0AAV9NDX8_9EURO|nr:hypothetical protein LTR84_001579 [Exophiala bonariae]
MSTDRRGRGRGGSRYDSQPRSVLVSKALSRLLRHAAEQERIPIDNHGYVRVDHLLAWQRLRSMKPPVTFEEVVESVEDNEKKRFALKYVSKDPDTTEVTPENSTALEPSQEPTTEAEVDTETQKAISMFQSTMGDTDSKRFFIRATQGHSMRAVEAENLLKPISLDDPDSIPTTVVHGTFYGAWNPILQTGGLKSMTRNHVHFATGPPLGDVLPAPSLDTTTTTTAQRQKGNLGHLMGENKVISGMRTDAQILVYIDIRKALQEEPEIKWWRSENGVILTEGIATDSQPEGGVKLVPKKYWLAAVEIKQGLGLLWKQGEGDNGVVQELPEALRNRAVPRGKGGGHRGGRGGRSKGRG